MESACLGWGTELNSRKFKGKGATNRILELKTPNSINI